jgi:hypothetical protein
LPAEPKTKLLPVVLVRVILAPELAASVPFTVRTPAMLNGEVLAVTDPVVAAMVTSFEAVNPDPEVSVPFTVITPVTASAEDAPVVNDPDALIFKVPPTFIGIEVLMLPVDDIATLKKLAVVGVPDIVLEAPENVHVPLLKSKAPSSVRLPFTSKLTAVEEVILPVIVTSVKVFTPAPSTLVTPAKNVDALQVNVPVPTKSPLRVASAPVFAVKVPSAVSVVPTLNGVLLTVKEPEPPTVKRPFVVNPALAINVLSTMKSPFAVKFSFEVKEPSTVSVPLFVKSNPESEITVATELTIVFGKVAEVGVPFKCVVVADAVLPKVRVPFIKFKVPLQTKVDAL